MEGVHLYPSPSLPLYSSPYTSATFGWASCVAGDTMQMSAGFRIQAPNALPLYH